MSDYIGVSEATPFVYGDDKYGVTEAWLVPPQCPRSKTCPTLKSALACNDDEIVVRPPAGPKSRRDLVKVRRAEWEHWKSKPKAAQEEPEHIRWPHTCPACGGRTLIMFSSVEHQTTGTARCPETKKTKMGWK